MESADALLELVRATLRALPPLERGAGVGRIHARLSELQELRERAMMRLRALQATTSDAAQSTWRALECAEDAAWRALDLALGADAAAESAVREDAALESLVPLALLEVRGSVLLRAPATPRPAHSSDAAEAHTAPLLYALRRAAYLGVTAAVGQQGPALYRIARRVWLLERQRRALQRMVKSASAGASASAASLAVAQAAVRVQRARQSVLVACAVDMFVPFLFEHFSVLDADVLCKARDRVQRLLTRLPWLGVVELSTSLVLHLGSISGQLRQYATASEAPVDAPRDEGMVALVNELFLPLVLHHLGTLPAATSAVHTAALLASLQRVLEQQRTHELSAHVEAHLDALLAWLCALLRQSAHAAAAASLLLALCTRIAAPVITLRIVQALAEPHARALHVLPWLRTWLEPDTPPSSAAEDAALLTALWPEYALHASAPADTLPAAQCCAGGDGCLYECPPASHWLRVGTGELGSVQNHIYCSAPVPSALSAAAGAHSVAVLASCALLVYAHIAPSLPPSAAATAHTLAFGALDSRTLTPVLLQLLPLDASTAQSLHVPSAQWHVRLVAQGCSLVVLLRALDDSLEVLELAVERVSSPAGPTAQLRVLAPRRAVHSAVVAADTRPAFTPNPAAFAAALTSLTSSSSSTSFSGSSSSSSEQTEQVPVGTLSLDYPDTLLGNYVACTARPELAHVSFEELRALAYAEGAHVTLASALLGAQQWREARFELRGCVLLVLQSLAPARYVWCRELDLHSGTLVRGYLQHAPHPLPPALCDRAHFRGPAVPSVARLLALDADARVLADDACTVEHAQLLVLAALCESLRSHARPVEVSRELDLLLALLVSFGADRAPSVALRAQCVLLAQLFALRVHAASTLPAALRERARRVLQHLLRSNDVHELAALWRRELSLVLVLPQLFGDVTEVFALSGTLLRSELAMLALLDAGPLPPTAYLGTSLALHLVLCENGSVDAVFALLSAPWPTVLATVLQATRDMVLIAANEARALLRHGVASRAFALPWTRVIAHCLEVHAARLDLGLDVESSLALVRALLSPLLHAGASLLTELAAAPSRPMDVGALLAQTYLALLDTHVLALTSLDAPRVLALASPLLQPLVTLLVVADRTLAQLDSRWLRLTTSTLALIAGQFIAALYAGPALSREEEQYDDAFLRLSFFRATEAASAREFSLVEDAFVRDLVKGVVGSAAMTFYVEMLARLKRSLPRKDNASLNTLERTFLAAVLRHTGLVRDALKIVHSSINVALELPVLTRVFSEALKIRLLAIEHSRRDPLGTTPLKHPALAAHLLSLPRAWRCVFEEPPSLLPSLLVEGRARRFSSGDAMSRLIRTLGRAQATPLAVGSQQKSTSPAVAAPRSTASDARAWSTLRSSVEEHRERLNREHEQRVLTTFKHWKLVKLRREKLGEGEGEREVSAASTSAVTLKIERIVDEILLFFRRAEGLAQVHAFQETKSLRADLRFAGLHAAQSVLKDVRGEALPLFLFALRDLLAPTSASEAHTLRHYHDGLGVVRTAVAEQLRESFHACRAQLLACVLHAALPVTARVLALALLPYKLDSQDLSPEAHAHVFERLYTLFHASLASAPLRPLVEQLRVYLTLYLRSLAHVRVSADAHPDLLKVALVRLLRESVACAAVLDSGAGAVEAHCAALHEHVALLTLLVDTAPLTLLRFLLRHADLAVLAALVRVEACRLKAVVVGLLRRLVVRTLVHAPTALSAALVPLAPALFEQLFGDVARGLNLPYLSFLAPVSAVPAVVGTFVSRWEHCPREVFARFAAEAVRFFATVAATDFGAALLTAHFAPLIARVTPLVVHAARLAALSATDAAALAQCVGLLAVLSGDIKHVVGARVSFLRGGAPEFSRSHHHRWLTGQIVSVVEEHALVLLEGSEEKLAVPLGALFYAEEEAGALFGAEAAQLFVEPLLRLHHLVASSPSAPDTDGPLHTLFHACFVARVRVLAARALAALVAGAPALVGKLEALVTRLHVPDVRDAPAPRRLLTDHAIDRAERALVTLALARPWAAAAAPDGVSGPDGWRLLTAGGGNVRLEGLFQTQLVVVAASAASSERVRLVANRVCAASFYVECHVVALAVASSAVAVEGTSLLALSLLPVDAAAGAEARFSLSLSGECCVGAASLGVLDATLWTPGTTLGVGCVRDALLVTKNGVLVAALPWVASAALSLVLTVAPTLAVTLRTNFGSERFCFAVASYVPTAPLSPPLPAAALTVAAPSPAPRPGAAPAPSLTVAASPAERPVIKAGTRYRAKAPKPVLPATLPELRLEELRQLRWGDVLYVRTDAGAEAGTVGGGAVCGRVLAVRDEGEGSGSGSVLLEVGAEYSHTRLWLPRTALVKPTHTGSADALSASAPAAAAASSSAPHEALWRTRTERQVLLTLRTSFETAVAQVYKALLVQYVEGATARPAALLASLPVDALLAHVLHEVDVLPLSALDASPPLFERRALLALLASMRALFAAEAHALKTPFGSHVLDALVKARLWLAHTRRAELAAWLVQEAFTASAPTLRQRCGADVLTRLLDYLDRPPVALRVRDRAHLVAQLLGMLAPLQHTEHNRSPASDWSEWVRTEIGVEHERLGEMADPERARTLRLLLELLWRMRVLGWDALAQYPLLAVKNEQLRAAAVRVAWAVYKDAPNPFDRLEYVATCVRTLHTEQRVPDVLLNEAYVALAHERVLDLDAARADGVCDFAHATALAVRPLTRDATLLDALQLGTDGNALAVWDASAETLLHELVLPGSRLRWRYAGATRVRLAVRPVFAHAYKQTFLEQHKMELYDLLTAPAWRGAALVDTLRLLTRYLEQLSLDDARAAEALFFCAASAELDVRRAARVAPLAQLRDVAAVPLGFALVREWTLLVAHALPHVQLTNATSSAAASGASPVLVPRLCEHVLLVRDLCWSLVRRDFVRAVLATLPRAESPLAIELNRFESALFSPHAHAPRAGTGAGAGDGGAGVVAGSGGTSRSAGAVDERSVFAQLFRQLRNVDAAAVRVPWRTHFVHEDAVDAGGLYRESLELWSDDLQSARVGLLMRCPNAQAVVDAQRGDEEPHLVDNGVGDNRDAWIPRPAARDTRALAQFRFVGRVLGAALCADTALALSFPSVVWKRLVGAALDVGDVRAFDSFCGQSLESLSHATPLTPELQHALAQLLLEERFTTLLSDGTRVELKPRGAEQSPTWGSRLEYVALVVHARLAESAAQVAALAQGLDEVVPLALLRLLTWRELERAVCGVPHVDWRALQAHADYDGYEPTDAPVQLLWRVLAVSSPGELNAFVRFVWGRSRLPDAAHWATRDRLRVVRVGVETPHEGRGAAAPRVGTTVPSLPLPSAATCFFQLHWPAYTSEDEARSKLLQALAMSQCFV